MSNISIKPFSEVYLTQTEDLLRASFEEIFQTSDLPARSLKAALDPEIADQHDDMNYLVNRRYWIVLEGGTVAGIAGLMEERKGKQGETWLNWFAVHPDFRGKGFGGKLLEKIKTEARAEGKHVIRLWTSDAKNEKSAQFLYEKMGFKTYKTEPEEHPTGTETMIIYRECFL